MEKARVAAVSELDEWLRKVRTLAALVQLMCDELGTSKRCKLTNCDPEVATRKVVNAQSDITILITELHRNAVSSYSSICRSVEVALVAVRKRLKIVFDRETGSLQQCVRNAIGVAGGSSRGLRADGPGAIDKSLPVIIDFAAGIDEWARSETSPSRTARQDAYADASSNIARPAEAPLTNSVPNSLDVYGFCDHSVCGS